ncbi:MAG TPA: PEGA domain-containing protein [Kofleriaceae bacterium]|nr:PEGA domain-containing protein [Kofleriaceae bacterium]
MPAPSEPRGAARRPLPAALRLTALVVAAATALGAAGCAASAPTTRRDTAILHVTSPVADAVVWVDGRYVAQVRDLRGGLALSPGHHQIELRHERYHATYGEVDLARGERVRLDLELAEALP